jgi:hypothetical protein
MNKINRGEKMEKESKEKFIIAKETLERLEGTSLFYPCSREDFEDCIELFSPHVDEFWFVDIAYFKVGINRRPGVIKRVIRNSSYHLISRIIDGEPDRRNLPTPGCPINILFSR